jgi:hypothetical protein
MKKNAVNLKLSSAERHNVIEVPGHDHSDFVLHPELPCLAQLYNLLDVAFFNTGVLNAPTNEFNYRAVTKNNTVCAQSHARGGKAWGSV